MIAINLHRLAALCLMGGVLAAVQPITATDEKSSSSQAKAAAQKTDGAGDPLPDFALSRLGTLRWRHGGAVTFVGYAAKGKRVVTASADGFHRVWDADSGKEILRFGRGANDPAGGFIAAGNVLIRPAGLGGSVALTADGQTLATQEPDGSVRLWNVETGTEIMTVARDAKNIRGFGAGGTSLAFSPDGTHLALRGLDQVVRLVDVASKATRKIGPAAKGNVEIRFFGGIGNTPVFLGDGKEIAVTATEIDNQQPRTRIQIYEVESGKELRHLKTPDNNAGGGVLAASPNGKVLAWSGQAAAAIVLYDAMSGKEIRRLELQRQQFPVTTLVFSPNGKTLASRDINTSIIQLWDVDSGKALGKLGVSALVNGRLVIPARFGFFGGSQSVAFSPDGDVLAEGTANNTVRFWNVATGREVQPVAKGHHGSVTQIAVSSDRKTVITFGADQVIRRWDAATGRQLSQLKMPADVQSMALAADGKLAASASANNTIRLWDLETGNEARTIASPARGQAAFGGSGLALSPDGKTLAVRGVDQGVRIYDTTDGSVLQTLAGQAAANARQPLLNIGQPNMVFSPRGDGLAIGGGGGTVNVVGAAAALQGQPASNSILFWDFSRKTPHRFDTGTQGIRALAFSPDGRTIVTLKNDRTISVWEILTGKECFQIKLGGEATPANVYAAPTLRVPIMAPFAAAALALSPDGRTLAVADKDIRLFDLPSGKELGKFTGHQGAVTSLAFAGDSRTLISGSADTTALVWAGGRLIKNEKPVVRELTAQQLDELWNDLAGESIKAFQAMNTLDQAPRQALSLFQERLKPAAGVNPKHIEQLVADLDSDKFPVRNKATDELEKLGDLAQPALQKALADQPSLETQRRLERLLEKIAQDQVPPREVQQAIRALQVLEKSGAAAVRPLLQRIAQGAPGHRLTRHAEGTLKRLGT